MLISNGKDIRLAFQVDDKVIHQSYFIIIRQAKEVMSYTRIFWRIHDRLFSWIFDEQVLMICVFFSYFTFRDLATKVFLPFLLIIWYLKSHRISFRCCLLGSKKKSYKIENGQNWAAWWSHVLEINISN